jgi:hypothetical protein
MKRSMLDNIHCAQAGHTNWFSQVNNVLSQLGAHLINTNQELQHIDLHSVLTTFDVMQDGIWDVVPQDPHDAEQYIRLATYRAWFATLRKSGNCVSVSDSAYWNMPIGYKKLTAALRFRLGCHNLAIECGRWKKPHPIPRTDRVCPRCRLELQDEQHFVLKCPYNQHVRDKYHQLLSHWHSLRQISEYQDKGVVISFIWDLVSYNNMA